MIVYRMPASLPNRSSRRAIGIATCGRCCDSPRHCLDVLVPAVIVHAMPSDLPPLRRRPGGWLVLASGDAPPSRGFLCARRRSWALVGARGSSWERGGGAVRSGVPPNEATLTRNASEVTQR